MIFRRKVCDICGEEFSRGIKIKGIRKRSTRVCEKCELVIRAAILAHRRIKKWEIK